MTDPHLVTFTVKELLQRLDERLGGLDQKLDLRLAQMDERIMHVERTQSERAHLLDEHRALARDVENLQRFHARFLPASFVVALLAILGLAADIYARSF